MKHIRKAVIQQDDLTGDLFVTIPEEVLKDLTWEEGDVVEWTLKSEVELTCKFVDEDEEEEF